jgi:two-component system cell cycle response regulator DivK
MIIKQSVLYIEDHEPSLQLVERLLSVRPYQLIKATTADDALALAQEYLPLVVLMDIDLPGMDGLTALRLFKQHRVLRSVPVIVITSRSAVRQDYLQAGAAGIIPKSLFFDNLYTVLRGALQATTAA